MKLLIGLLLAAALPVCGQQRNAGTPLGGLGFARGARGSVGIAHGHGAGFDRTIVPAQETGRTFSRPASTFSSPASTFSQPSFTAPPFVFAYPNGRFFNRSVAPFNCGVSPALAQAALLNAAYDPYVRAVLAQAGLNPNIGEIPHNYSWWGPYNGAYQFPVQQFQNQTPPIHGDHNGFGGYGYGAYPFGLGWGGSPTVFLLSQDPADIGWMDEASLQGYAQGFGPAFPPGVQAGEPFWPQGQPISFGSQTGGTFAQENPLFSRTMPPGWVIAQAPQPPEPVIIDFPPGTRILR